MKTIESFANQVIQDDSITVLRSMPGESVDLVITDPPYLVNYLPLGCVAVGVHRQRPSSKPEAGHGNHTSH